MKRAKPKGALNRCPSSFAVPAADSVTPEMVRAKARVVCVGLLRRLESLVGSMGAEDAAAAFNATVKLTGTPQDTSGQSSNTNLGFEE